MRDYTINPKYPLLPEQNECIDFMLRRARCICSAQTGLGKTYLSCTATLYLLNYYKDLHCIMIIPQKALKAFKKELSQKLHTKYNIWTSSGKEVMKGARITLVTHTALSKYVSDIIKLRQTFKLMAVVDEIHNLQNPDSKFYKLMLSLRKFFSIFYGLTATPLKNDISGLYHMINLVEPGYLGSWNTFCFHFLITRKRYIKGRGYTLEITGTKNRELLQRKLQEIIILRQKVYNLDFKYHSCELTEPERKRYFLAGKGLLRESAKKNWAVRLHDLQQVVDNVHNNYEQIPLTNKERLLLALLKQKNSQGDICVVFSTYYETLFRIKDVITKYKSQIGVTKILEVHGKVDLKQREKVEELIEPGSVVLITEAGTESINLQRANSIIFYDIPFGIQCFTQACGRVTRMDTKFENQAVHILEARGTIDTYKRVLIQSHTNLITMLFGKMETLPLEVVDLDRNSVDQLRKVLLWSFSKGTPLTDELINNILKGES